MKRFTTKITKRTKRIQRILFLLLNTTLPCLHPPRLDGESRRVDFVGFVVNALYRGMPYFYLRLRWKYYILSVSKNRALGPFKRTFLKELDQVGTTYNVVLAPFPPLYTPRWWSHRFSVSIITGTPLPANQNQCKRLTLNTVINRPRNPNIPPDINPQPF